MKRATRIAFLSEHASPAALLGGVDAGGQNVYVDELSRHLARLGYAIDVFTRRMNEAEPEILEWAPGVRIIHLEAGPVAPLSKDALWPYMPVFRDACLHFIEREERSYDLVHGNFWLSGWVAGELQQRLSIPATHIFHALGATKRRHQGLQDSSDPARIEVERRIVRQIESLIAPCPAEQQELVEFYQAEASKISLIPLAVNTEVFRPVDRAQAQRQIGVPADQRDDWTIVYVGRVLPRKDIRNIVRALALLNNRGTMDRPEHPNCRLLVVGGESEQPDAGVTPEIGELQALTDELGVHPYVSFCGKQQQDRLRFYYSAADVVVTTPWYEPFGLTPLEAMACGRPVIGSDVGGISYSVRDGETGFLVPPRDPQALAERLMFLRAEPDTCVRMGQAARQRVEQEFTWPIVARRTAAVYEHLLARHNVEMPLSYTSLFSQRSQQDVTDDAPIIGGGE